MKIMDPKKLFAALIAVMMSGTMLAGCGDEDSDDEKESKAPKATVADTQDESKADAPADTEAPAASEAPAADAPAEEGGMTEKEANGNAKAIYTAANAAAADLIAEGEMQEVPTGKITVDIKNIDTSKRYYEKLAKNLEGSGVTDGTATFEIDSVYEVLYAEWTNGTDKGMYPLSYDPDATESAPEEVTQQTANENAKNVYHAAQSASADLIAYGTPELLPKGKVTIDIANIDTSDAFNKSFAKAITDYYPIVSNAGTATLEIGEDGNALYGEWTDGTFSGRYSAD